MGFSGWGAAVPQKGQNVGMRRGSFPRFFEPRTRVVSMTGRATRKCFCLATGFTAVHLVRSSFFGFSGFIGIALIR